MVHIVDEDEDEDLLDEGEDFDVRVMVKIRVPSGEVQVRIDTAAQASGCPTIGTLRGMVNQSLATKAPEAQTQARWKLQGRAPLHLLGGDSSSKTKQ